VIIRAQKFVALPLDFRNRSVIMRRLSEHLAIALHRLRRLSWRCETRVADLWGREMSGYKIGGGILWTELPGIQRRINQRVSGDHLIDPYQWAIGKYFTELLPFARALTLGCGNGELERGLAKYGFCSRHDAFDIAPGAVEFAAAAARAAGLNHIHYEVADLNHLEFPEATYDCVLGVQAVHHVEALEHVFSAVQRALKPRGFLLLNEFVGPTRFQWTERQLDVINGILKALPEPFRRNRARPGVLKSRIRRPSLARIVQYDPSEAVRSSEILPLLQRHFEVLDVNGYGGTILHMLLHEIAGNFADSEPGGAQLLDALCDLEEALIACGDLTHDFAVVVARKL
jgi:O-antigen biosynthesis protein